MRSGGAESFPVYEFRGVPGPLALAPREGHALVAGEFQDPASAREADVAHDVTRNGVAIADRERPAKPIAQTSWARQLCAFQ